MAAAMPSPAEAGLNSQVPPNVLPPTSYTQFTNSPLPVAAGGQTVAPTTVVAGAMAPGQYQLTSTPVHGHGPDVAALGTGTAMQPIGTYSHPVSANGYYQPLQGAPSQAQVPLGPPAPWPYHQAAGDPLPPYQQSVAPMDNGFATSPMPPQAPTPAAATYQSVPAGYPQQPRPAVGAWDVAKIAGGRFIDLKCFSRLPGLKPGPAQMVNGILDLALIWVDLDAYLSIPEAAALGLGNALNFDACWHMGQEHRSFWEQTFTPVRRLRRHCILYLEYCLLERPWPNRAPSQHPTFDRNAATLLRPLSNANVRAQFSISVARDKFYSKAFSKLRNNFADVYQDRSSTPSSIDFKPAWPAKPPRPLHERLLPRADDVKLFSDLNRTLDGFMTIAEGSMEHHGSHAYTAKLAAAVGLLNAANTVSMLYPGWGMLSRSPDLPEGFGTLLHRVPEEQAKSYMIGIACCGVYRGHHGWQKLSGALALGAWPWLRGYLKVYAKAIYVIMVSLCSAVELGYLDHTVFPLLMGLAGCLVGRSDVGGGGQWRIRYDPRLLDAKSLIQAVPVG